MELTGWQTFVVFMWGEFKPTKYLAYMKRLEQGMAERPAFKFVSEKSLKEIEEFMNIEKTKQL